MINPAGLLSGISTTELLLACIVFTVVFLILKSYRQKVPIGTKPLPGPFPLPVIGNLLSLSKDPHISLTKMSEVYGDVLQIHIGTKPVLVLSGLETIRQALLKQGDEFLGRPDLFTFRPISNGESLTFSHDSGEVWKARRKMAQNALKSFATSPSLTSSSVCLVEEHISKEAEYLISKIQQVVEENVICAMCFGKHYNHDDESFVKIGQPG